METGGKKASIARQQLVAWKVSLPDCYSNRRVIDLLSLSAALKNPKI